MARRPLVGMETLTLNCMSEGQCDEVYGVRIGRPGRVALSQWCVTPRSGGFSSEIPGCRVCWFMHMYMFVISDIPPSASP